MTQPEARATAVIGDPQPTPEIPLQERGKKVFAMIDDIRQVLWATPEFGESLAKNYLSPWDQGNRDFIGNGVFFERGGARYTVHYEGSAQDLPDSDHLEIKEKLVVNARAQGNSQRVVLDAATIKGVVIRALANYIDGWGKESSLENLDKPQAFDKMNGVLQQLKKQPKRKTPTSR